MLHDTIHTRSAHHCHPHIMMGRELIGAHHTEWVSCNQGKQPCCQMSYRNHQHIRCLWVKFLGSPVLGVSHNMIMHTRGAYCIAVLLWQKIAHSELNPLLENKNKYLKHYQQLICYRECSVLTIEARHNFFFLLPYSSLVDISIIIVSFQRTL